MKIIFKFSLVLFFLLHHLCASAQDGEKTIKKDGKTKTTVDGMTTKTKMADDGRMKIKSTGELGNKKIKTKSIYESNKSIDRPSPDLIKYRVGIINNIPNYDIIVQSGGEINELLNRKTKSYIRVPNTLADSVVFTFWLKQNNKIYAQCKLKRGDCYQVFLSTDGNAIKYAKVDDSRQ